MSSVTRKMYGHITVINEVPVNTVEWHYRNVLAQGFQGRTWVRQIQMTYPQTNIRGPVMELWNETCGEAFQEHGRTHFRVNPSFAFELLSNHIVDRLYIFDRRGKRSGGRVIATPPS